MIQHRSLHRRRQLPPSQRRLRPLRINRPPLTAHHRIPRNHQVLLIPRLIAEVTPHILPHIYVDYCAVE